MSTAKGSQINANILGATAENIEHLTQNFHDSPSAFPKPLTSSIPILSSLDNVIGRDNALTELQCQFQYESQLILVHGVGGVGKTCLAQAYATKFWDDYQHVVWVTQVSDFVTDFVFSDGLLENLNITKVEQTPEKLLVSAVNALNRLDKNVNLLVIDNADDSLAKWKTMLPKSNWHILVTSRMELEGFTYKELGFLEPKNAVQLFQVHFSRNYLSTKEIEELVKIVDYHTLVIEILASTAHSLRLPFEQLQKALSDDIVGKVPKNREGNKHVSTENIKRYLNAVFLLDEPTEVQRWLLVQFVYLPPEFHTFSLLEKLIKPGLDDNSNIFNENLDNLKKRGWLIENSETDSYKMHTVIAESLISQLQVKGEDIEPFVEKMIHLLSSDQTKGNPIEKFIWLPFGRYLESRYADFDNNLLSRLQNNLALVLRDFGDYISAKKLLEKAIKLGVDNFDEEHPEVLSYYSNLALILKDLGDILNAKVLFEKVVASNEAQFGDEHLATTTSYSNLAIVLRDLGDNKKAKVLLEKVLTSFELEYGCDHPSTARGYSNLGTVLRDLGDYTEAKKLFEKAVISDEISFGEMHPTTAIRYTNLASVLQCLGECARAKQLFEKVVRSDELSFREGHPIRALDYANLAGVLEKMGDFSDAKELLERAVASDEVSFSEGHPNRMRFYSNLGQLLQNLGHEFIDSGDYKEAEKSINKALKFNEAKFGEMHHITGMNYAQLALALLELKDYEGALKRGVKAHSILKSVLPEGHDSILITKKLLQSLLDSSR
ncbi:tetratricopeptide repeat protein [Paraglaciecola sp.]|uniref:tetratricopeptide repeat protein n=1 Tax=Paraglaciecola sp. TaxID=1920173 RepID=UPI0032655B4D